MTDFANQHGFLILVVQGTITIIAIVIFVALFAHYYSKSAKLKQAEIEAKNKAREPYMQYLVMLFGQANAEEVCTIIEARLPVMFDGIKGEAGETELYKALSEAGFDNVKENGDNPNCFVIKRYKEHLQERAK